MGSAGSGTWCEPVPRRVATALTGSPARGQGVRSQGDAADLFSHGLADRPHIAETSARSLSALKHTISFTCDG
jgi:hypothetical protein